MVVAAAEGPQAAPIPDQPTRPANNHLHAVDVSPRPAASPNAAASARINQHAIAPPPDGKPRLERVEFLITPTPVEGCELMPYVVIRTASGEAKSAEAIEAKTRGALSVQYRWNRVAATYVCARSQCLKPATMQFVPLLKIADERCIPVEQQQAVIKQSFFCGSRCLQASWPNLRSLQSSLSEQPKRNPAKASENVDDVVGRVRSECVAGRDDGVFGNPLENPLVKTEVAWIRNYAPTEADVGAVLELVCRYVYRSAKDSQVDVGPPMSIKSRYVKRLPDPPPLRQLTRLGRENGNGNHSGRRPGTVRVLTYNVLAEIYTTAQTYPNCPNWALAWTYRKRNLIREMSKYEADILCLQEVQADHYEDHFSPYFQRLGYQGCYKVKTRESMGRKGKIDGCATLWRKEMYTLRHEHTTEYNTVAQQRTKNSRALNRCLKGNVALFVVLDATDGSGPIVIANTHLFWDPDLTDVKLFQVDVFLSELEIVLQNHRLPNDVPIVIGGDFNSEPMSSVYEFISTGLCSMTRNDVPNDSYGVLSTCQLRHRLSLRSAYSCLGQEPEFTNYTTNFVGVLDYLWFSPSSLEPTAILEIPNENVLLCADQESTQMQDAIRKGIPNTRWSSDHIALMAEFQLVKRGRI